MVRSDAETVDEYLDELPDDRRGDIEAVRRVILENLPEGYDEVMRWGMITYEVPLDRYPDTYNGVAVRGPGGAEEPQRPVSHQHADDVALDVIAETIASAPVERYLAAYEQARGGQSVGS